MFIPDTPWSLFAFRYEVFKVIVRPISQHLEHIELTFGLGIRANLQPLRAINHIFRHTHFQPILNDVIVKTPCVEICLFGNLIPDARLDLPNLPLLGAVLQASIQGRKFGLGVEEDSLVLKIDIKLEHVLSCQLRDMLFVPFDLVLDPHNLMVSSPIKPSPKRLDLLDPGLVRDMRRIIGVHLFTGYWKQVFQGSHLGVRCYFLAHDELDLDWGLTCALLPLNAFFICIFYADTPTSL